MRLLSFYGGGFDKRIEISAAGMPWQAPTRNRSWYSGRTRQCFLIRIRLFGDNDKALLLQQLGYGPPPPEFSVHGDACRTAGFVLHIPSGDASPEVSFPVRWRMRQVSIENLLHRIQLLYGDVTDKSA